MEPRQAKLCWRQITAFVCFLRLTSSLLIVLLFENEQQVMSSFCLPAWKIDILPFFFFDANQLVGRNFLLIDNLSPSMVERHADSKRKENENESLVSEEISFFKFISREKKRKERWKCNLRLLTTNSFSRMRSFVSLTLQGSPSIHPSFSCSMQLAANTTTARRSFQSLTSSLSILGVCLSPSPFLLLLHSFLRLSSPLLLSFSFSLYCRCRRRLLGSFDSSILKFHRTMYCR